MRIVVPLAENWEDEKNVKKAPTRDGYGKGVVKAGEADKNVVVLCADLTESTRSLWFKEKFPERFFEIGVAEQNLATVASGMAKMGKIPFIASYCVFSPGRNNEQIRTTISYNNVPVKIVGAHAGISVGPDGATHQALEDIGLMRMQPNMQVIVPCDAIEAEKATIAIAKTKHPSFIRLGREKTALFTTEKTPFEFGQAQTFIEGNDVTIIACGSLLYNSLQAARDLEKEDISVEVINIHTIKPIDRRAIINAAKKTNAIVTVEEHQINGGLGGAVAEVLGEEFPVPMVRIGVRDRFGESGDPNVLIEEFGMGKKSIINAVKEILKKKHFFKGKSEEVK